ncbi:MAG: hypothetical protein PHX61_13530 [Alphaproteobacteria bacterium]|nr:hypothetical protein [Alphaproteobacteria bacterium]
MDKKYNVVEIAIGSSLGEALIYLIKQSIQTKRPTCGKFNGTMIYSDIDSLDSAYQKVTGKTYAERCEEDRLEKIERDRRDAEEKAKQPEKIQRWIERGARLIPEAEVNHWAGIVPIRANDLYCGMELDACLDIIELLNSGCAISVAKEKIDSQNHSGMSYSLVRALVRKFAARGEEFAEYVK